MNLVTSLIILKTEKYLKLQNLNYKYFDGKCYLHVSFDNNGTGTFCWGNSSSQLDSFEVPVMVLDKGAVACFTSTPSNAVKLAELLSHASGEPWNIVRLPFYFNGALVEQDVVDYSIDPITGATFCIRNSSMSFLSMVKVFTNGVISFTMTNSEPLIRRISGLSLQLMTAPILIA